MICLNLLSEFYTPPLYILCNKFLILYLPHKKTHRRTLQTENYAHFHNMNRVKSM